MEFSFEDSRKNPDEIFAAQQLFEILKTFRDKGFNELYIYRSLEFHYEYDEVTDEEDSVDEEENIDDYDEQQYLHNQSHFILEE
ncbi:unnamed protein product, partial [Rotaria sp. Silwood2]